ncbi:MAG: hypothetical protein FJ382_15270, partial [Verrucomicrobia bacterium]|nr:hypothetical protein [Verrucomicrobiota bacterium]
MIPRPTRPALLLRALLLTAAGPAAAQVRPPAPAVPPPSPEEVRVMSEFKVFDKKPVPFTDANMDIPRGINDVQAYYILSA